MRLLKYLFLIATFYCSSYCQAQEFDTIRIDNTVKPSPTYVRIKFPHKGFVLTDIIQRDANIYPASTTVSFVFRECKGDTGINYFDTGLLLYIDSVHRLNFYLVLDSNNRDTSCVRRSSWVVVDTVQINYPTIPTSIKHVETMKAAIYPNPVTNHRLTIETNASRSRPTMATFYSLQGSKVATYTLGEAKTEITLPPHLPAGNYLLLLQAASGFIELKRITVQ